MRNKKSIYYKHYKLSDSIDIFYRTIVTPMLEFGLENEQTLVFVAWKNKVFSAYMNLDGQFI